MIKAELDIATIVDSLNLTEELDNDTLNEIGDYVATSYEEDNTSRYDWLQRYEQAQKLAAQVFTKKNEPWANASNVKHPLLSIAAIQFHAKAYPALIPSGDVVTGRVVGRDPDGVKRKRAERIGMHMTYQLKYEMEGWEEHMDSLLLRLPITGCEFTKTFFNPETGLNQSSAVNASNLVVNYYTENLKSAARITEVMEYSGNEIIEKQRAGLWADIDMSAMNAVPRDDTVTQVKDDTQGMDKPMYDDDTPYEILEQHNFLDLDGDGYREPYIVTIDKASRKVLRIVARFDDEAITYNETGAIRRISPHEYYTKYSFIPSPDGGFYDMGFGTLLGPINETVNTLINQLVDSGTVNALSGGFISKSLRIRGGNLRFKPFEWKTVNAYGQDLKQGIFPLPTKEPSDVLFKLLSYLVQAGERLAGTTDMMVGENPGQNQKATTTMAVLDQGMKVFTAIYKRVRRAEGEDFLKLYKLNATYLNEKEEFSVVNPSKDELAQQPIGQDDYMDEQISVFPSADPNMSNQLQRLQSAQAVLELPHVDTWEATRRMLDAMEVPDIEAVLPPKQPPPPTPEMVQAQLDTVKEENEERERSIRRNLDRIALQHQIEMDKGSSELAAEAQALKELEVKGKIVNDAAKVAATAKSSAQKESKETK